MLDSNENEAPNKESPLVHDNEDAKNEVYTVSSLLNNCTFCPSGETRYQEVRTIPSTVVLTHVDGTKSPIMMDLTSTFSGGIGDFRNDKEIKISQQECASPKLDTLMKSDEKVSSMFKKILDESSCRCAAFDCQEDEILDIDIVNSIFDDEEEDSHSEEGIELDWDYYDSNTKPRKGKYQRLLGRLSLDKNMISLKNFRASTPSKERPPVPWNGPPQTSKNERSRTPRREQRPSLKLATSRTLKKERSGTSSKEMTSTRSDTSEEPLTSRIEISWTQRKERVLSPNSSTSSKTEEFTLSSKRLQKRLEEIYKRELYIKALDEKIGLLQKQLLTSSFDEESKISETDVSETLSCRTGLEVVRLEV